MNLAKLIALTAATAHAFVIVIYSIQGATVTVPNQMLSLLLTLFAFGLHLDILFPISPSREQVSPEEQSRAAQGSVTQISGLQKQRRGTQPRGAAQSVKKGFGKPR